MAYRIPVLALACALNFPVHAEDAPVSAGNPACPPCPCAQSGYPGAYGPYSGAMPPFGQPPAGFFTPSAMPDFANRPDDSSFRSNSQLRIERGYTQDGYSVKIYLSGQKPEDLRLTTEGRWLLVHTGDTQDDTRQYAGGDYQGYSFSRGFSHSQRRISLPPDADVQNMTRSDSDGLIELHIPRQQQQQ